jgi:hypothetical protein
MRPHAGADPPTHPVHVRRGRGRGAGTGEPVGTPRTRTVGSRPRSGAGRAIGAIAVDGARVHLTGDHMKARSSTCVPTKYESRVGDFEVELSACYWRDNGSEHRRILGRMRTWMPLVDRAR